MGSRRFSKFRKRSRKKKTRRIKRRSNKYHDKVTKFTPKSSIKKQRVYRTLDNGGNPYEVLITKNSVKVFKIIWSEPYMPPEYIKLYNERSDLWKRCNPNKRQTFNRKCWGSNKKLKQLLTEMRKFYIEDEKLVRGPILLNIKKFKGVWVPDGFTHDNESHRYSFKGNSILVKLDDDKYIYIGESIFKFKAKDRIINYLSPVGNSGVPYPYAVGEKYLYPMFYPIRYGEKDDKVPYFKKNYDKNPYIVETAKPKFIKKKVLVENNQSMMN